MKQLETALASISLKQLEHLQPPSKAFQHDGAAMANLSISIGKNTYKTPTFDHLNPNKEIAKLVTLLNNMLTSN